MTPFEIISVIIGGIVMVATVGAYAYNINRNTQKDTEEKIRDTKKELRDEISAKTSVERQLSSQEIKRLEQEVQSVKSDIQSVKIDVHAVSSLISNHIQYSRENHPTNQTVFPVLENIQTQIQKLSEKFDHEKEEEVRELKRQLESARGARR